MSLRIRRNEPYFLKVSIIMRIYTPIHTRRCDLYYDIKLFDIDEIIYIYIYIYENFFCSY